MSAIHLSGSEINIHFYHLFFKLHSNFAAFSKCGPHSKVLGSDSCATFHYFFSSKQFANVLWHLHSRVLKIILSYCTTTLKLGFLHDLIQVKHLGKSIRHNVACLCILTDDTVPTCTPLVMRYSVEKYFQLEVYSSNWVYSWVHTYDFLQMHMWHCMRTLSFLLFNRF